MAQSGGQFESEPTGELRRLLRACQRDIERAMSRPFEMQSENRRHNGEVWSNTSDMIAEIEWELDFRERAREECDERERLREERREQREAARREAQQQQTARRQAREAEEAALLPANPAVGQAARALAAYFKRTKISQSPDVDAVDGELTWSHNTRQFIASYTADTNSLKVWMLVAEGTPGATLMNGKSFMPADDFGLIRQARVAEAKRPKRKRTDSQ